MSWISAFFRIYPAATVVVTTDARAILDARCWTGVPVHFKCLHNSWKRMGRHAAVGFTSVVDLHDEIANITASFPGHPKHSRNPEVIGWFISRYKADPITTPTRVVVRYAKRQGDNIPSGNLHVQNISQILSLALTISMAQEIRNSIQGRETC